MSTKLAVPSPVAIDLSSDYHRKFDQFESQLAQLPGARTSTSVHHTFTPGLYSRTVLMRKGEVWTSKLHKTEHQYVVLKGRAKVQTEDGLVDIVAPYAGITKAGTRRILIIEEDMIWITFHPTTETELEKIEAQLILSHTVQEVKALKEGGSKCLG